VADLFGLAQRFPAFFAGEPLEVKVLDARRVRVAGSNNFELWTTTDAEGVFSFPTLPAGTYSLDLDPPPSGMTNWHLNRAAGYGGNRSYYASGLLNNSFFYICGQYQRDSDR
jgi:hypothetical protein